jgi:serine/threonine protein kinase
MPEDGGVPPGYRLGNFEMQGVVTLHANGVVYRGWDHNLGIPVAIKEYLPQRLAWRKPMAMSSPLDGDTIDAFERGRHAFVDEARLLARCDHPNLVRVRQLLQAHGTAYRVMQWYSGRPLLDVRREMTSPPDEPALRALLSELLGALEAYHRVGGVHGSVNPAQIMLLDDDRALLLGPCAARRATAIDAVESLMRQLEPSFVAPEQLAPSAASPVGPWTDFYALARVVRFCISGMLPAAPGSATPEPLGATVAKLYFDKPGVHYSESFWPPSMPLLRRRSTAVRRP